MISSAVLLQTKVVDAGVVTAADALYGYLGEEALDEVDPRRADVGEAWIQTSSATVDLKAAISSAMASAGVLQSRVFLGRLFISAATSLSQAWLTFPRSVPLGMNWRSRPLVFSFEPRCQGACGPTKQPADALLAIATLMFGENHATFLTAEVLTSSVHRNILCPLGFRCCT